LLRQYRVAAALSQEALAERAGLSARTISDLERGVKTSP
jgi:transcriptional regulator with XRE-family HTH domain